MSETPSERQAGIDKHGGEQVDSVKAKLRAPGSRSLGRMLWRFSIALFWFVTISAGALSAGTLWAFFASAPEPRRSDADTLGSQFEARKSESLGAPGPLKITGAARPDLGRETGTSSPDAAEPNN